MFIRAALLVLVMPFLTGCSTAGAGVWFGVPVGYTSENQNAMDQPAKSDPTLRRDNAKLLTAGAELGARTGTFLKIFRLYTNFYAHVSPAKSTSDAVGEFTGKVSQAMFGVDFGIYLTDWLYFYLNPIPYTNFIYTSGTKLRPLPGRTTDLGHTWDTGIAAGIGIEHKFTKKLSLGLEYRDLSTFSHSFDVDSTGFAYDNHYYGLLVKFWY